MGYGRAYHQGAQRRVSFLGNRHGNRETCNMLMMNANVTHQEKTDYDYLELNLDGAVYHDTELYEYSKMGRTEEDMYTLTFADAATGKALRICLSRELAKEICADIYNEEMTAIHGFEGTYPSELFPATDE